MQEVMECLFQVLTDMLMQFSSVFVFWSFASPDIMQRGDRRDERVIVLLTSLQGFPSVPAA